MRRRARPSAEPLEARALMAAGVVASPVTPVETRTTDGSGLAAGRPGLIPLGRAIATEGTTTIHVVDLGISELVPIPAGPSVSLGGMARGTLRGLEAITEVNVFGLDARGLVVPGLGRFHVVGDLTSTYLGVPGHSTGKLTLYGKEGWIDLDLLGPAQPGSSPLPGSYQFKVTGGTAAYKGATGGGTLGLAYGPKSVGNPTQAGPVSLKFWPTFPTPGPISPRVMSLKVQSTG